jgi:hypothetical protein
VAVRGLVRASSDQAVIATLEAQGVETMVGDVRDYAQDILARA